jgi:beta-xylosidase
MMAPGSRSGLLLVVVGLCAATAALAEAGDYVLIQFGHNDMPGKGEARETDPASTFPQNLARYVDEARERGLAPVLVTSLTRRRFGSDGHLTPLGSLVFGGIVADELRSAVPELFAAGRPAGAGWPEAPAQPPRWYGREPARRIAENAVRWQRADGSYRNPVLFADYSDPDAIRVGDSFYLVSSSFSSVPAIPVLRSRDLVSWRIVGHVAASLPSPDFDTPQHGKGVWAPSLRYHDGRFWLYFGDPDRGIFMSTAERAEGPWEPLALVEQARGWIDPCPLFDDDGSVWLVHAWAKSRAGFNGVLTLRKLGADGRRVVGEGTTIFEGGTRHPTIEGPKLYKRDGWYYVFAPAGGVPSGWQVVLRSRHVLGPYQDRIVLAQGTTEVNGPHQGAWVETAGGASWFLHFQERGAWGRVVHLEPMAWRDGWPVIGRDPDGDGAGEPVASWTKPRIAGRGPVETPATTDEFDGGRLGLQWQWPANPRDEWWSLTERPGWLRLHAVPSSPHATLWDAPFLLLQKLTGPVFTATTSVRLAPGGVPGTRAGLVVMGRDYAVLALETTARGARALVAVCRGADAFGQEAEEASMRLDSPKATLRVSVDADAVGRFSVSRDGRRFEPLGQPFTVRQGVWIGARAGVFAQARAGAATTGQADFDWFRVE